MKNDDWHETTLGEIARKDEYGFVDGPFGSNLPASLYTNEGVPVVRGSNLALGHHRFIDDEFVFISPDTANRLRRSLCGPNDIIFTKKGTLGQTGLIPPNHRFKRFLISSNQMKLSVDGEVADPLYVYYFVSSPDSRHKIIRDAEATGVPKTNLSYLRTFPILLPSLVEQRAIANLLGTLDDKIELNRRMNKTLRSLAQAIFKSWFIIAARTKLPNGWCSKKLGELLSVIETGGRPRGGVREIREGVPSVGAESIVGIGYFDYTKTKFVPRQFFQSMNKGHVQHMDVLLYKDGGRPGEFEPHVTIVGDGFPFSEFAINEHVYRLRTDPALPQSFLYFWLSSDSAMDEMRNRGTGVAIPGLNSTQVRELMVLCPPIDVVTKFDNIVSPFLKRIFANCNESRTLSELRDSLLPRLLSGEISLAGPTSDNST
jgi:type I restriction enzyme S subunit